MFWKTNIDEPRRSAALRLLVSILLCLSAGWVGSLLVGDTGPNTWYQSLNKSVFNPPPWVFAPVWTTLYLLMGISFYLVWRKGLRTWQVRSALILFLIQLAVNISWNFFFFRLQSPLAGFVVILLLWVLIEITLYRFSRISLPAALLLIPYWLWVTYAGLLNYAIWRLNP